MSNQHNNHLSYIAEHLSELKLGADDTFHFHCDQCGKCCIDREDILLNPLDVYRAAKELGMTTVEFVKTYCECYIGDTSAVPIIRLRPRGSIKRCPLLKDRKCSIQNAKPTVCALFPIGRVLAGTPANKMKNAVPTVKDITFIYNPPGCGDLSETHTVREWLGAFGIPIEDEFFIKWQTVILRLSASLRPLLEALRGDAAPLYNDLFALAYLSYETQEDFMPQFEEVYETLLAMAERMSDTKKTVKEIKTLIKEGAQ